MRTSTRRRHRTILTTSIGASSQRLKPTIFAAPIHSTASTAACLRSCHSASLPIARLAWLQLFKKSPYDLRALAKVPPSTNPVTLALAARTYALTGKPRKARPAVEKLASTSQRSATLGTWRVGLSVSVAGQGILRRARRAERDRDGLCGARGIGLLFIAGKRARRRGRCRFRRHGTRLQERKRCALHRLRAAKPTRWCITPISGARMCLRLPSIAAIDVWRSMADAAIDYTFARRAAGRFLAVWRSRDTTGGSMDFIPAMSWKRCSSVAPAQTS